MRNATIEVTPCAGAAGAQLNGVDLTRTQSAKEMVQLKRALLDHLVIAIPRQSLTSEQLIAFGEQWGELFIHPNLKPSNIHPGLIAVERKPGDIRYTGSEWHTDTSHMPAPPALSIMYAKTVPATGGDTVFANQYLAFATLSDGLQRTLRGLRAIHSDARVAGPRAALNALRSNKTNESADWRPTRTSHPVVRTHPDTGREALYVNVAATLHFDGMSVEESAPLLNYLFEHNHRPEFTYRHAWREDMLIIWDNRALVHLAVNDCPNDYRLMHRLQVAGNRPQ